MITNYKIVEADSIYNLEFGVQMFLDQKEGWQPHGDIKCIWHEDLKRHTFYQTLVKVEMTNDD